ncbi:unnamed protein product [Candidula unifasciata]|uniref:BZIP domain-containing protein n=1 Tax=Candidula unifasciata TaxID=100452 RepID=A0A8S4A001_9EUPU|nr:unnamed protein product [Candidula unifasciata]
MTYQSNLNIKAEPFSPTAQNDILAMAGSKTVSRTTTRGGTPAKRPKSETRELQASTPEIKKKLQSAVLDRRKANGFTGIPNNLFEEPTVSQLTKADIERREKRKEQNRKAAKKCRAKKKELQDKAEKETAQYAESNVIMQRRLYLMYQRLCALAMCFSQHLDCGDCRVPVEAKEKDRQFISETIKFLESCTKVGVPEEEQASFAEFSTDHNDTSQLSSISDNYTSNSEAVEHHLL